MREVSEPSSKSERLEPQEFLDRQTSPENRHANYGMHELNPEDQDKGMHNSLAHSGLILRWVNSSLRNNRLHDWKDDGKDW